MGDKNIMYCNNCGEKIDDNAAICPSCGMKIEHTEKLTAYKKKESKTGKKTDKKNVIYILATIAVLIAVCAVITMSIKKHSLKNVEVGDYITFGKYEQDNNKINGKEDIEWLVIDKKPGKILVVSRCLLDCKPYIHFYDGPDLSLYNRIEKYDDTDALYEFLDYDEDYQKFFTKCNEYMSGEWSWSECELHKWLNDDFYTTAYSQSERKKILPTKINDSVSTDDKVFLLSDSQINMYLKNEEDRRCRLTDYALKQLVGWMVRVGCFYDLDCAKDFIDRVIEKYGEKYSISDMEELTEEDFNNCVYISKNDFIAGYYDWFELSSRIVDARGDLSEYGGGIDFAAGVRPAMWISID